jgi:hypothetical protein
LKSDEITSGRHGPWALDQERKEFFGQAIESGLSKDLNLKKCNTPGNLQSLLLKQNSFPLTSDTKSPDFLCSLKG